MGLLDRIASFLGRSGADPDDELSRHRNWLYDLSVHEARKLAETCVGDPNCGRVLEAARPERPSELARVGAASREWLSAFPHVVLAFEDTELGLMAVQDRPGFVVVGMDSDGAVYLIRDGSDAVLRTNYDQDSLEEIAPSLAHAVLQVAWEGGRAFHATANAAESR